MSDAQPVRMAGRELDAMIAEKVMGIEVLEHSLTTLTGERMLINVPHYSTSIAAAWFVVEKLAEQGWEVDILCLAGGHGYDCVMKDRDGGDCLIAGDPKVKVYAHSQYKGSCALAICRAALKTLEAK